MPTFAFLEAPQYLTVLLLRRQNAPLPPDGDRQDHSFGGALDARVFSAQERSTSELLRTL